MLRTTSFVIPFFCRAARLRVPHRPSPCCALSTTANTSSPSTATTRLEPSVDPACQTDSADKATRTAPSVRIYDVRSGTLPYDVAWRWQHALVKELKRNNKARDALILLEHDSVYTMGTRSDIANVLGDWKVEEAGTPGAILVQTERGGEVTFHGPGQLVAYPVMNLTRAPHKKDLHWYIRTLESVVVNVLGRYGLEGKIRKGKAGVWVEGRKVAAVGLKVSKWVTMHGIALNVDVDLKHFSGIIPCGLHEGVTSLREILGPSGPSVEMVKEGFVWEFGKAFGVAGRLTWDERYMRTEAGASRSGQW